MFGRLYQCLSAWRKDDKYRNLIIVLLVFTILLSATLFVSDYKEAKSGVQMLERKAYGEGESKETLEVFLDGEKQKEVLQLIVGEQCYTEQERKDMFSRCVKKLETGILGNNKSLNHVTDDLVLMTGIAGEPVRIEWRIDRYDIINIYGEINEKNLKQETEPIVVKLEAHLAYTQDDDESWIHVFHANVSRRNLTKEEQTYEDLISVIEEINTETAQEKKIHLPANYNNQSILYKRPMNMRSLVLLVMGILCAILIGCMEKQNKRKVQEEREKQMMQDYPIIIGKLNLLLGAGMTVKNAWRKIVEDYEHQKRDQGPRYAYEEMEKAYYEMQSGVLEKECYERFGRNCGNRAYRKIGALLSQNLRKGAKGIMELLELEAIVAYEERKAMAKRLGEEAGIKLLFPMFLMLCVVLIIVILPAFLTIRI